jgi:hypothetical protein
LLAAVRQLAAEIAEALRLRPASETAAAADADAPDGFGSSPLARAAAAALAGLG